MAVLVSGLHSGPNPSPGVGTARSLRAAFPDIELVGVDYSLSSSGLHWPDFDDVWVAPSWSDLDLPAYAEEITARLADDSVWLSGLDLETIWLSSQDVAAGQVLVPSVDALRSIKKPAAAVAEALGLGAPPSLPLSAPASELAAFGRVRGWQAWLKGPFYEAQRVVSWSHLLAVREQMKEVWGTDDLHLQAHVVGLEESVAFAAYQGVLLGACAMTKQEATAEGKTWAGTASEVDADLMERVTQFVADTQWTGGAEVEMVRDPSGRRWLLELNPRFPAWIHGATLAGRNLPAALVAAALGRDLPRGGGLVENDQFSRVVVEVPIRDGLRLPARREPRPPASAQSEGSKHPSGMTMLARLLERGETPSKWARTEDATEDETATAPQATPDDLVVAAAIEAAVRSGPVETPGALLLESVAQTRFGHLRSLLAEVGGDLAVRAGYSIKTNPDLRLLSLARANGFLAEAISQYEVGSALRAGFGEDEVVLNGPGKWWPAPASDAPVRTVFCDSLTELAALTKRLEGGDEIASVIGVRIRPPGVKSRFGVPVSPWSAFEELAERLRQLPSEVEVGIHFHSAQSFIGVGRWWASFEAVLRTAAALEEASGRAVVCFDVGGGWYPEEWDEVVVDGLRDVAGRVARALPSCRELIVEPGKALVQPVFAVLTSVLDIHEEDDDVGVVVDAAIAELPDAASHPHRVFRRGPDGWSPLPQGRDRILGRSCMEHDVLSASVAVPPDLAVGDLLAIADAGAYDQSMAYRFARGAQ